MQTETRGRSSSSKPAQPHPAEGEDLFKQKLLEIGLLGEVKIPHLAASTVDRTPIQIEGEALSQTIVEERR